MIELLLPYAQISTPALLVLVLLKLWLIDRKVCRIKNAIVELSETAPNGKKVLRELVGVGRGST